MASSPVSTDFLIITLTVELVVGGVMKEYWCFDKEQGNKGKRCSTVLGKSVCTCFRRNLKSEA